MLFNSLSFFVFLPAVLVVFAALPVRMRWVGLLLASYLFYAASSPFNLVYLGAVTCIVYACGWGLAQAEKLLARRLWLTVGLIIILGALIAFKFYDFAAGELERLIAAQIGAGQFSLPRLGVATPVGYSFYAFMAASYLIDAYRGRLSSPEHPGHTALYLAWFPKILAGPIERATNFLPQIDHRLRMEPETFTLGLQLIGWGLVKKVVIADNLAPLVDRNFQIAAFASPVELLTSVYFFAFQIYCDFSGYTDIAIGVSLLFGIKLMENFRRPYLARSTAEFWGSRWHISLGHWFRDYLYIPLGGSQKGWVRRYVNLMTVFIVSGLWHAGLGYGVGWTFLVWGALNGFYQWVEIATAPLRNWLAERLPLLAGSMALTILRVLITFHLIAVAWVFFRAKTLNDALLILKKIWLALPTLPGLLPNYPFTSEHALGAGLIAVLILFELLDERRPVFQRLSAAPVWLRWASYYAGIFGLLILGRWQLSEFIYMQF